MQLWRFFTRAQRDERGAAAVEFAIVGSTFFMMLFGVIEYGLVMFSKVALESAVQQASRSVSIGTVVPGCSDRACSIKKLIQDKTQYLINRQSVSVSATVVSNSATSSPPVPDICLSDPNDPYPATCTSWQENGGNPAAYDPPSALSNVSLGQAGDIVEIRAVYLWRVIFPMFNSYFGNNGTLTITSSSVVKNEPF